MKHIRLSLWLPAFAVSFGFAASTLRAQTPQGVPVRIWAQVTSGNQYNTQIGYVSYACSGTPPSSFFYPPNNYYYAYDYGITNSSGQEIYAYYYFYQGSYAGSSASISGTFLDGYDSGSGAASAANQQYLVTLGSNGTVQFAVGKTYTVYGDGSNIAAATLNVAAPPQYRVVINGVTGNSCALGSATTVTILPAYEGPPGAAGFASSVPGSRLDWRLSLGALMNGDDAGSLRIVDSATESDWSAVFTPAILTYDAPSAEIFVYRVNNQINQIIANQVAINVVTLSSTSFEIDCYNPSQVQGMAPASFAGQPFAVYRISKGSSATSITFTKETRNVTDPNATGLPIARSETMTLARSGGPWPTAQWTKTDWTQTGQNPLVGTSVLGTGTVQSNGTISNRTEAVSVGVPGGGVALNLTRNYTLQSFGEALTQETLGTSNPTTTTFSYYGDVSQPGVFGYVQSVGLSSGAWEAYDYYDSSIGTSFSAGRLKYRYRPFGNLPGTATHNASLGAVTYYEYGPDPFGFNTRPTLIQTKINGVQTGQTTISYDNTDGGANDGVVVATQRDYSSSSTYLTTLRKYYSENAYDAFIRNKPYSVQSPDGVKQSYLYEKGTWDGSTFTSGATPTTGSRITVIAGTALNSSAATLVSTTPWGAAFDPVYVINGKSTMTTTIRDVRALTVRTESYAWMGSWVLTTWVNYTYNFAGLLVGQTASNGTTSTSTYDGQLRTSDTDAAGKVVNYTYDVADRVAMATQAGAGPIGALATTFSYDAAGHVLTQTAGAGQVEQIVSSKSYDDSGRVATDTPAGLGVTSYAYDVTNRITTVTHPDGGTTVDTLNLDGSVASETGTAVVAKYSTNGVETDGRTWVQVNVGTATSPRWEKSWKDWIGRESQRQHPGVGTQPILTATSSYNDSAGSSATGHLRSTSSPGVAATLFTYDPLGNAVSSGLDVNSNGVLDTGLADRIAENDTYCEYYNGAFWLHRESRTYPVANSATKLVVSIERTRLTGFPTGVIAEKQTTDVEGNITDQQTAVNPSTATTTVTTTKTGYSNSQVAISVNGLPTSFSDFDGLTSTTTYDGLLRKKQVKDSRGNATTTAYISGTTLVQKIIDGTGTVVATSAYDTMGRAIDTADAVGHHVYSTYTLLGQVFQSWGAGTLPVQYGYDSTYGDRTTMSTFRGGTGWDQPSWPGTGSNMASSTGTADTTIWTNDAASGKLLGKTDASGRSVTYSYNNVGQLSVRTWARGVGTAYTYDPTTGEQTAITYSDGTPALTYSFNRQGSIASVQDYTGAHAFGYDTSKPWRLLSETLDNFYGNRVMTRLYEAGGVVGRIHGFQLGSAVGSNSDIEQTYVFGGDGRFSGLTTSRISDSFGRTMHYTYLASSDLISGLYVDASSFTINRAFDPQRDVLTSIAGQWSNNVVTRYDYTVNNLYQRSSVVQSGSAFSDYGDSTHQTYTYDGRGQLVSATGYLDGTATDTTKPLPNRVYAYSYDNIGNRQTSNETSSGGLADHYSANSLNQYVSRENNAVALSGTADAGANILVEGRGVLAARQGRYWSDALTVDNISHPWRGPLTIYAGKPGGAANGGDLIAIDGRMAQIAGQTQNFTYDADGNLTGDGIWIYSWDGENRLVQMSTDPNAAQFGFPNRIIQFNYDYLGRRVQKLVIDATANTLISGRRFLYDGWNLVAEFSISPQTAVLTLIRSYTWGLDISTDLTKAGGVGALLQIADHASGKTYLPTYDGNGNVAALLNADTGAVAAVYEYSPYGEALRAQVNDPTVADQPFRFSTKYYDQETRLLYYGNRYYDPRNGRLVGRDPSGEKGGIHLYAFCVNNPINIWDVLGQDPDPKSFATYTQYAIAVSAMDRALNQFWGANSGVWNAYYSQGIYISPTFVQGSGDNGAGNSGASGSSVFNYRIPFPSNLSLKGVSNYLTPSYSYNPEAYNYALTSGSNPFTYGIGGSLVSLSAITGPLLNNNGPNNTSPFLQSTGTDCSVGTVRNLEGVFKLPVRAENLIAGIMSAAAGKTTVGMYGDGGTGLTADDGFKAIYNSILNLDGLTMGRLVSYSGPTAFTDIMTSAAQNNTQFVVSTYLDPNGIGRFNGLSGNSPTTNHVVVFNPVFVSDGQGGQTLMINVIDSGSPNGGNGTVQQLSPYDAMQIPQYQIIGGKITSSDLHPVTIAPAPNPGT